MSTMAATATATPTTTKPAAPAAPKSYGIKLTAGDQELVITARVTKSGASSDVTHYKQRAVKGQRRSGEVGARQEHTTFAAAKAAVDKIAADRIKAGWTRPERTFGFSKKADAFGLKNLPAPPKK